MKKPCRGKIWREILFSLSLYWQARKVLLVICALAVILRVALPYLGILLPKVVLDRIAARDEPARFIQAVGGVALLLVAVNYLKGFTDSIVNQGVGTVGIDKVYLLNKLALARALYKDAPVVVLDEPTAALDPIAEYEVYTAFDRIIGPKTAVFISHRLSSCRFCHDIAVFDGGRLVQRGNHETLLKDASGRYYELWNAQARHYNGDEKGEK